MAHGSQKRWIKTVRKFQKLQDDEIIRINKTQNNIETQCTRIGPFKKFKV